MSEALVIDDVASRRRLRRPSDVARLVVAVSAAAAVGLVAYIAQSTTSGLDQDIAQGANRLPSALLLAASLVSGFGSLALPAAAGVDLLSRRRYRQAVESIAALLLAIVGMSVASWFAIRLGSDRLLLAFAGPTLRESATPLNAVLGGLAAFVTVARLLSRPRWQLAVVAVMGADILANVIAGGITAAGLAVSTLAGWSVGLIVRYAFGTDTTRPSGRDIADAVERSGFPLHVLRAAGTTEAGRLYDATAASGKRLHIVVLDRDLEGAGFAIAAYRSLRLRDSSDGGNSMRRRLERAALATWAASAAGVRTPQLLAVTHVGPDAAAMVFDVVGGRTFEELAPSLGDAELAGAWEAMRDLQHAGIAHKALRLESFRLAADGRVYIRDISSGAVAASDVLLRIDLAEALCVLAAASDAHRAIAAGRIVLGDETLARALPALQPFALSLRTRRTLRPHKDMLSALRSELVGLLPPGHQQPVELERIKPRNVLAFIGGTVAAYLLLGQFARVNLLELVSQADVPGVLAGLGFSMLTYVAATAVLHGIVPERMSPWKTLQTQFAASFATLVAPPTLGSVAINVRYLTKQGLRAAVAAASVAVMQVLTSISHLIVLFVMVVVAGTTSEFAFRPPRTAIIVVAIVAMVATVSFTFPVVRRWVADRVQPIVEDVLPRLTALANQPLKLALSGVGVLTLNLSYCLCLYSCVRAFTDQGSLATIALVYLTTSVIAIAAPTPGGLGAIEAATVAGLTAAGIDSGLALSATLVFRLVTFWIPTIPGWLAFHNLQRSNDL